MSEPNAPMQQSPYPGQYPSTMEPHRGTLILVFGILGLIVCVLFGVAAWVMGNTDLRKMDAGVMDPSGRDMTNAGKICGMIASILAIVGLGIALIWVLVVLVFAGAGAAATSM